MEIFPTPNYGDAQRFIDTLCGENAVVCWQVFVDRKGADVVPRWKHGTFQEQRQWLYMQNAAGAGIYLVVNETDGEGRSTENITRVRALFVDLDKAPKDNLKKYKPIPNIVVESSQGRYHGYWLVQDCSLKEFSHLQSALAHCVNGDRSVKDLPRVMRVPGFVHLKDRPFVSKILYLDTNHLPTVEEIVNGFGISKYQESTPQLIQTQDSFHITEGDRNSTLMSAAARMRRSGLSGSGLLEAVKAWNNQHCDPPLSDRECQGIADWCNKKECSVPNTTIPDYRPQTVNIYNRDNLFAETRNFKQLQEAQMDPIRWIIDDVLPEGLCILAGRPKVGKSWLIQSLCISVAQGTPAMNHFDTNRGVALSISLEDSDRRFRERLLKLRRDEDGVAPENAYFINQWPRMPQAAQMLRQWMDEHGDTKLVVIDTLARIQAKQSGKSGNSYYTEYDDIGALQAICSEYRIAIIVVHHLRKGEGDDDIESVSGTTGITGAADTIALLRRPDRMKRKGILSIRGRDISDRVINLDFQEHNGLWVFEKLTAGGCGYSGKMEDVMSVLRDGSALTRPEIARAVYGGDDIEWKHRKAIERAVKNLLDANIIIPSIAREKAFIINPTPASVSHE